MDFLNKLYDSNYFGIGLFAVISFLVVTFLVVLFFGKKDEQKRKLQERKMNVHKIQNTFNETSKEQPVEVSAPKIDIPINPMPDVSPVAPINFDVPIEPKPINYDSPIMPNIPQETYVEPVVTPIESVKPVVNNVTPAVPKVEPIRVEPTKIEIPNEVATPVVEPVKISIPEPEVAPVVKPVINETVKPVIEEPEVTGTYYKPVERDVPEEVKVPNIDFDAIAKSISEELEELEKLEKTTTTEMPTRSYSEPKTQFSSVYVKEPTRYVSNDMDLPKRVDLPNKRDEY
ncbi:MAG: hypothetical protein NC483_01400 [Ruminococcus sp.]|nr:hypothetical protein [Ruminococcus sp.]